ncbi:DUF1077-domain-containing protein [Clavulina sp. PMI_390]|nr:DUF1077-domain-containing protein [Clavulina sp. PMI_390]
MPATLLDYTSGPSPYHGLPNPPGFASSMVAKKKTSQTNPSSSASSQAASYAALKQKRAWDFAISPGKSLPMNAMMLYMSGGGVQIFSIGILAMLLLNPIKAVASINAAFAPFEPTENEKDDSLILQKLVYIGCNILTMALGLYKCSTMGLLPTGTADWLAFETRGMSPEFLL